jgi:hypothetical protein
MESKDFSQYAISIKEKSFPYASDWKVRQANNKKKREQLEVDFYIVLNKIIENGGVICVNKYNLDRDHVVSHFNIKITPNKVDDIGKLKEVDSVVLKASG